MPNESITAQFCWAEKLLDHRNCAKINPNLKRCIFAHTVEATGRLRAHSQPRKKSTSIAPLNKANITNWVLKRQILSTVFPLSPVMTFQTRTRLDIVYSSVQRQEGGGKES